MCSLDRAKRSNQVIELTVWSKTHLEKICFKRPTTPGAVHRLKESKRALYYATHLHHLSWIKIKIVDNNNTSEASGASGHQFQREYNKLVEALINILIIRKSANEFDVTAFITGKLLLNAISVQMNSYLLDRIISYRGLERNEAFTVFYKDFEEWTKEVFAIIHKKIRRAVRHKLKIKRLYTGLSRDPTDNQLAALVKAEDLLEWDRKDLFSIAAAPNSPIGLL